MDLLGTLYEIDPIETRNFNGADGQPREYRFCEVVIDCSEYSKMTGERYENLVPVIFSGKSLDQLANFAPGSRVIVSCHPKGGSFTPPEGGRARRYVKIRAFGIKLFADPPKAPSSPAPPLPSAQRQTPPPAAPAPQPAADSDDLPF